MSLCLIDVHGDIEGDFEWVEDLPKNRKEFLIAIDELEKIKKEIEEKESKLNFKDVGDVALKMAYIEVAKIIYKHISELKGDSNGNNT